MVRKFPAFVLAIILTLIVSACGTADPEVSEHSNIAMAPLEGMPAEVLAAPISVQQSYQYAVANPETLKEIPCYCGCGSMGHTSNYDCFVQGQDAQGAILYDSHALGCSICVDITLDVMRLQAEGKDLPGIRTYIDETYARYGPSNIP